jgi:HEAT repeat protein
MSRELLQALIADADRLLVAGGSVATGDEGLRRREKALRDLGGKVPVLAQVAENVNRVLNAGPKQTPAAVLDLVVVAQQLRFSLAAVGADGPLTPAEPSGPWATDTPTRDACALKEALDERASGRLEKLKDALERQGAIDLRLVGPLMNLLDDGYGELADLVAEGALPAFGPAVLPELRRQIDLQGGRADARRLVAICQTDAKAGTELCHTALRDGGPVLRIQALKCLGELEPAAAERVALLLLGGEQPPHVPEEEGDGTGPRPTPKANRELRAAALSALGKSRNPSALAALVAAATDVEDVWNAAAAALRTLPQPKTAARLVEELRAALANVEAVRGAKNNVPAGKAKPKGKAATPRSKDQKLQRATEWACRLVEALGQRGSAPAVAAVRPLLEHPVARLRLAAVSALGEMDDLAAREAAAALIDDPAVWRAAVLAAWRLPARDRYERLAPLCEGLSSPKPAAREHGEFVLMQFNQERVREPASGKGRAAGDWDPRWGDLLARHLDGPNPNRVAHALAVVRGPKAVPDLLRVLEASVKKGGYAVVEALAQLRAREAVAPLIELLGRQQWYYHIPHALRRIGDPDAIPPLKELLDRTREPYRKRFIEELIDQLEQEATS